VNRHFQASCMSSTTRGLFVIIILHEAFICADISQRRKSTVGHHYRGAKMALWLDLIPRLHRSDNLDARYHQLDNYADLSSFDEDGTRLPEGAELALLRSLASTRTERSNASVSAAVTDRTTTASWRRRRATTTARPRTTASRSAATVDSGSSRRSSVGVMSLSVTIGIGCGLLVVNAAVLTALYCKRGRLGKMRQQLALLAPPGECAQLVDADRSTMTAYVSRQTIDVDGSSPASVGLFDGGLASSSLVPAPPPPPEPLSPHRRTHPLSSWRSHGDPDHIALTSTSTKPDNDSSHINAAILTSVTSRAPSCDVTNHVTSSTNDTVV